MNDYNDEDDKADVDIDQSKVEMWGEGGKEEDGGIQPASRCHP